MTLFDMLTSSPISTTQRNQILFWFLSILLLLFTLIGGIGWLFERYIARLEVQVDSDMWKLVDTRIVTSPQQFKKIALKKSHRHALKDFFIPYLLLAMVVGLFFAYQQGFDSTYSFDALFDYTDRGFTTLFPIIDWENIPRNEFFGLMIPSDFPALLNSPRFVPEATISYVIFFISLLAILLIIRGVLALYARTIRIYREANTAFTKSLKDVAKKL
jgi:hypothetical protein